METRTDKVLTVIQGDLKCLVDFVKALGVEEEKLSKGCRVKPAADLGIPRMRDK